ncbi:hypothetical protein [Streptomyces sp. MJP52]|uniref:hypothetical protein n=1 Tax=Streptomyces sp. MJP52 TaxID=2940555 RepID=UPI0024750E4F|nr:hypothetical protein [Streptomyces sp. MJP52]MDH6228223.1 hypothetical protein [Streptomyces sp. MJP52]
MHDKPLSRITGRPRHRRPGAPNAPGGGAGPDGFGLDEDKVEGFTAGTLGPEDEARLAEEVAALLPLRWSLSPRAEELLSQVNDRLGGNRRLMEWLDGHPGLPRLTARLVVLTENLDRFGENGAVVDAVRAHRGRSPLPAELRDVLPPDTDEATLSAIAHRVEELLGERRAQDATRLALATTDWLGGVARDAAPDSPEVAETGELMSHLHADIAQAAAAS